MTRPDLDAIDARTEAATEGLSSEAMFYHHLRCFHGVRFSDSCHECGRHASVALAHEEYAALSTELRAAREVVEAAKAIPLSAAEIANLRTSGDQIAATTWVLGKITRLSAALDHYKQVIGDD